MKYFGHGTKPKLLVLGETIPIFEDPCSRERFEGNAKLITVGEIIEYWNGHALRECTVRIDGEGEPIVIRAVLTDEKGSDY